MANVATNLSNALVGRVGLNFFGAKVLTVEGRKSGIPRSVLVNPIEINDVTYLLSPRGETQWVRNTRVAGNVSLLRGRISSTYQATEITDPTLKLRVMKTYLTRWSWQVQSLMGVSKGSPDKELSAILENHPMFLLTRS